MHRLLVALLAAVDALVAAAVGLAAALAPLTVLWAVGFGVAADWSGLWPAAGSVWQLGHLVPVAVTLDDAFIAEAGLPAETAGFVVSLAPLAFAAFTAIFAARSGRRAAVAGGAVTGPLTGIAVTAILATVVALTAQNPVARTEPWQAVLFPVAIYAAGAVCGAFVVAWQDGDDGIVDALHERIEGLPRGWREVPALALRGASLALAGVIGAGALVVAAAVVLRGGEVIVLFEAARVDPLGTVLIALAQLAYLPTLIGWAVAWLAGPGFAVGSATAVSPAGTQLGVVPGVPVLGLLPEQAPPWLLLVLLIPVAAGVAAGWAARVRYISRVAPAPGLREPVSPRLGIAAGIGLLAGVAGAGIAWFCSGAIGPGRLVRTGPDPGHLALALGLEVLIGCAIMLFAPRRANRGEGARDADPGERDARPDGGGARGDERATRRNENAAGPHEPVADGGLAGDLARGRSRISRGDP